MGNKSLSKVVWCDENVFEDANTKYYEELKVGIDIQRFKDVQSTDEYMSKNNEINFIVVSSGSLG